MNADKKPTSYNVGDRVIIRIPLAGTSKPEETGLQYEIIMDEGLTGTITAVKGNDMVSISWDKGKYRIYKDLDLATMKNLDKGTIQLDGFKADLHSSYLEKIQQADSSGIDKFPVSEQNQDEMQAQAKNDSFKDYIHLKFIEEGDTLESAREKILSRIPQGHTILLERIITDSDEHSLKVHGKNKDECYEMAKKLLPDNISIIKEIVTNQFLKNNRY